MKRIAIFCDGTWNRSDAPHQTNVVRLSPAVTHTARDGVTQQLVYMPGVGAGRGSNAFAQASDKVLGGALGWGMTQNIEEAYRHLAFSYEPGDDVFIFGFSRGAFTARSLAGLIRSCGIPSRENVRRIPEAIARYRDRSPWTHPNHERSYRWRADFSPHRATSPEEVEWRKKEGVGASELLEIAYLGVWDTVGALGIPGHFPGAALLNRGHRFHDADLSRMVKAARHGVAIDERRRSFPPTLWQNLDILNDANTDLPYRQEWFPGDHGSVGGGGDVVGLSNLALLWVAEGAMATGLWLAPVALATFEKDGDPAAPLHNRTVQAGLLTRLMQWNATDRDGPHDMTDVSAPARARWHLAHLPRPWRPGACRPGWMGRHRINALYTFAYTPFSCRRC